MAGGKFLKSGGVAALAFGLAFALPAVASAQDRGQWNGDRNGGQQHQGGEGQRGGWNRGEARGGGGAPQAQVQSRAPWQGNRGGIQGLNNEARGQTAPQGVQQTAPRTEQRQGWNGQNRGGIQGLNNEARRSWNDQNRGDGDRWRGNDRDQARGDNRWRNDGNRGVDNNRWRNEGNRRWNGNDNRRWDNTWRRDNRYDWSSYRNAHRGIYHLDRYYAPYRNWTYRRLGIGYFLQPLFYSSTYWINDPWYYRLPEAYGPYRWVRYYDDALLVDIYSGEVVDVIDNFFW